MVDRRFRRLPFYYFRWNIIPQPTNQASILMEWDVPISPIGFGLKLLGAYTRDTAPYCLDCLGWGATVNHSTCMAEARSHHPTLYWTTMYILWRNSLLSSSLLFSPLLNNIKVVQINCSTIDADPSPAAAAAINALVHPLSKDDYHQSTVPAAHTTNGIIDGM